MRPLPQSEVSKRDGRNRQDFAPPRQVVEPLNAGYGVPAVFDQEIARDATTSGRRIPADIHTESAPVMDRS